MPEQQLVQNYHVWNQDGKYLIFAPAAMEWMLTDSEGFNTFKLLLETSDKRDTVHPEVSPTTPKLAEFIQRHSRQPAQPLTDGVPPTPEKICLFMTANCNIHCVYCYAKKYIDHLPIMTYEQGVAILERCKEQLPSAQLIFTGGEPLTDKNSYKLMQYAKNIGYQVRLETNGSLITEEKIDLLRGISIQISIDGLNAEINNLARGRFDQVINGIDLLLENGLRPELVATLTANNINYAINLFNYWRKRGVTVRFFIVRKFGLEKEYAKLRVKNEALKLLFENLAQELGSYKKAMDILQLSDWLSLQEPLGYCALGRKSITIDGAGNVYLCVHSVIPGLQMGNIFKEEIADMLHNALSPKLYLPVTPIPTCSDCAVRFFCGGGCRAEAYYGQNKVDGRNIYCDFIQDVFFKCLCEEES